MQLALLMVCLKRETPAITSEQEPTPYATTQGQLLGSPVLQGDE